MVIDVITYNGEAELFDLRYNILSPYVDEFIVVEFDTTFSGKKKDWLFPPQGDKKIKYFMQTEADYEKYRALAESSPNTKGAEHWKREFMQKESIKDCLTHLDDSDIVFIGDVDEIWDPRQSGLLHEGEPKKLNLLVYTYYLNNRSTEQFSGTLCGSYKYIKNECLNHLRSNSWKTALIMGWHFTSMGGYKEVERKLTDSYTQETYAHPHIMDNLEYNITHDRDFLGRDFVYTLDESNWPQYLKDNREKYKHLIKI